MLKTLERACFLLILLLFSCTGGERYDSGIESDIVAGKQPQEDVKKAESLEMNESEERAENSPEEASGNKRAEKQFWGNDNSEDGLAVNTLATKQDTGNKIYSGYGELKVDVVEEAKKEITRIAETNGGYVEDIYEDYITVRVPARQFSELFKQILLLGEVLSKSIETIDVSEYYTDLKARLDISIKTRARLYSLLSRTQDVKEQLEILKEIKRLSEEIERITLELKLVENQILYSRITIRLLPRIAQASLEQKKIPFGWIANLNPLFPSLRILEGSVDLPLAGDFAVWNEAIFRAESADGVRVRVGTTVNTPRGDTGFWQQALNFHLQKFYQETKPYDGSLIQGVLLKSKDAKPFYYLIAVAVKEDKIFVVEVFFPSQEIFAENYGDILNSLKDFRIK